MLDSRIQIRRLASYELTRSDFNHRLELENRGNYKTFSINPDAFRYRWFMWYQEVKATSDFPTGSENVPVAHLVGSLCAYLCSGPIVIITSIHETTSLKPYVRQMQDYIGIYASQWFAIDFCLWKYRRAVPHDQVEFLLSELGRPVHIGRLMNLCSSYAQISERARNVVLDFGYPLY